MTLRRHDDSLICTTCCRLRSVDRADAAPLSPPDLCDCTDRTAAEMVWTREQLVSCTVCASCVLAIAPGHTRWRRLHCDRCASRVKAFNTRAGRMMIPLGIHSIVNALPASSPTVLASSLTTQSFQIERLGDHVHAQVATNLRRTGLDGLDTVPFSRYLVACEDAGISDQDGWEALVSAMTNGAPK